MKFEVGDGYKTRDGRDAGIYWIGDGVIHGWYAPVIGGDRNQATWLLSGRRHVELKASTDIMPKPEPLMEFWDVYNSGGINVARGKDLDEMQRRFSGCKIVHMREVRDE